MLSDRELAAKHALEHAESINVVPHEEKMGIKGRVKAPDFAVKDSGARAEFSGGMVRDTQEGKIDWWRCSVGPLMRRLAVHLTKGNVKYPDTKPGVPNWTLAAGEEEKERFRASAFRHFMQWYYGELDEDHFAATVFNMNGYEYVKDKNG